MKEPTVFIVDDDMAARKSIAICLGQLALPCITYESAESFLAEFDPDAPGALVVDLSLPHMNGVGLVEHLSAHGQLLPAIVLTAFGTIQDAVHVMKLGVVEFLEKPCDAASLLAAIRIAINVDGHNRAEGARRGTFQKKLATLSDREREVLDLVVLGSPNKTIAEDLGISIKTVENHRARIMAKTGAANAADLVRMRILAHRTPLPNFSFAKVRIAVCGLAVTGGSPRTSFIQAKFT